MKLKKYISYYKPSHRFYIEGMSDRTVGPIEAIKYIRENKNVEIDFRGYLNEGMAILTKKLLEKDNNLSIRVIYMAVKKGCLSSAIHELEKRIKINTINHIE